MSTIKDIAKIAGVSVATVSRYLNGTGYVSAETGRSIDAACVQLNYTVKKRKSKNHTDGQNDVIGVIFTKYNNSFFAEALKGIEKVAAEHGKEVIISLTHERPELEMRKLEILRSRVGGLIITPVTEMVAYNASYIKEIDNTIMPVVLLGRDISLEYLDGVFEDDYMGAMEGVSSLVAEGHRDIAILSGPTTCKPGLTRLNGYMQALKNNHIPVREEYILYGDFDTERAYQQTKKLLQRKLPVTAVFAANVDMGLGVLKAIDELGMKIPDDIAFLMYDDFPTFDFKGIGYSVIKNSGISMGEEAASLLLSRMKERKRTRQGPARRVMLTPTLQLRGSESLGKKELLAD